MNKQFFIKNTPFDKSKFEPVSNWMDRPDGGLWTADYNEKNGSTWLSSGTFDFESDNLIGHVFSVNSQANILTLNTVKDALDILSIYYISTYAQPSLSLDGTEEVTIGQYKIDFEKMSQTYDAISVSHEVANGDSKHDGRFSPFPDWRIASTLWFNIDHLELENKLSTLELKALLMNAKV